MRMDDTVVAVFPDHAEADAAVKKLTAAGFDMKHLSVIGKGYHTEEKVVGFYNMGDRVKFWGSRGAFWGGLWGLFFGGLFLTIRSSVMSSCSVTSPPRLYPRWRAPSWSAA